MCQEHRLCCDQRMTALLLCKLGCDAERRGASYIFKVINIVKIIRKGQMIRGHIVPADKIKTFPNLCNIPRSLTNLILINKVLAV
jgi:hypothetical protein